MYTLIATLIYIYLFILKLFNYLIWLVLYHMSQAFWSMYHGYAGTIVVAKVAAETDKIVGGYNPLAWDNSTRNAWMETNDSFIFSLKNGNFAPI